MTVVDHIDLDDDECYVKVDFIDLSSDEDSVEKDGNVEEDDNVARSENVAKASVSSLISEQDATPATSLSKLEQEQPATTSLSTVEHGASKSSILAEETMQPEHQKFLATSNVSEESTRFGYHGLIAVGDFVAEAMQSEHEAEASLFSSMTEQGDATSLLLTKQGAISSSLREDRAIQSGNQVFVAAVYCTEEATQSENTAKATMTEIGSTYKSHRVEQQCQMIGFPHIVEDDGNAMGSTGIYNCQAHEEAEGDGEKDENCDIEAEPEALCQEVSHNGLECCMVKGCTNGAHGSTPLCIFHNSRQHKRCCAVIGCTKGARTSSQGCTDRCIKHGGGKRCKYDGCAKGAKGSTDYCIAHGGGRRCKLLECSASATYKKDLCSMHRTSLLSGNNSAHEILPAPTQAGQAKKAEPSKRRHSCSVIGGRAQKRQKTNDYVNARSFSVTETAEEKGRAFVCQNNMLKAQQTTQGMNSESGLAEGSPPRKFRKLAEVYT